MSKRRHGARMDPLIGDRQDLLGDASCSNLESAAAGSAHAERIPAAGGLELVVFLEKYCEHLVGIRRILRPPRGCHDAIGLGAIRDDGRIAGEGYALAFVDDRS